jgi:hypothetical protein
MKELVALGALMTLMLLIGLIHPSRKTSRSAASLSQDHDAPDSTITTVNDDGRPDDQVAATPQKLTALHHGCVSRLNFSIRQGRVKDRNLRNRALKKRI